MTEYLVTMTTQVPEATPSSVVDDVRREEAEHTRKLATQGRVLRLWRPPLAPGEWRTIGLFAARDSDELHRTLTSMPLSIWRTDVPLALSPHPNDPGADAVPRRPGAAEFLVTFELRVPAHAAPTVVDGPLLGHEAARARELATAGRLVRLWSTTDADRNVSLWQATSADELREALLSLPLALAGRLTARTTSLSPHPSDPAAASVTSVGTAGPSPA